jgi:thymidine kinase
MPKLHFRHGAMNSSKTANLLMVAHNYRSLGRSVIIMKPSLDTRDGEGIVSSRAGISMPVDLSISYDTDILTAFKSMVGPVSCVLVDEAQFLTSGNVDQLRELSLTCPVICYGLRTDYMTNLFPGSKRLMEVADSIEEIKTVCVTCSKKAIVNAKFLVDDTGRHIIIREGSSEPDLGSEEKYRASCWECWIKD